jgi:tetratricopeptide (TPR) repeat protein
MTNKLKRVSIVIFVILFAAAMMACGGPDEKKAKFFDKGQQLFEQGEYVKAALEFKNAIQIDPNYAAAYFMLGRTQHRQGDLRAAYGAYNKAVDLDPDLMEAQLEVGRLLLLGGRSEDAMKKADILLKKDPEHLEALMLKGSVLLAQDKGPEAIEVLESLRKHAGEKPEIYLLLATAYARDKKMPQAEEVLKAGVAAHPEFVPLHLGMARFYGESMQPDKAESALHRVIELEPDKTAYKFNLADLYWREGRQAAAIDMVDEVVATEPSNERIRLTAARFFIEKNQLGQAARLLEGGVDAMPESHLLRLQLGDVYLKQKKLEAAVDTLKSCLTLSDDPADAGILQAKNALAKVYLMMRKPDISERYVEEVLSQDPKSVDAHLIKGTLLLGRGEGASAVSEFRIVVSERPRYIPAYLHLADAHVLNKEVNLALDVLNDALKVDDASKDVRRKLARLYNDRGDYGAAEAQLRKIVEQHPGDARARVELGDFMMVHEKAARAEDVYRSGVEESPQNPLGYLRLARLLRQQGKPDKALAELEAGYEKNPLSASLLTALIQTYVALDRYSDAEAILKRRIEDNSRDVFSQNLLGWVFTEQKNYALAEQHL